MLRMTRAQERDRGLYSCLASNEAGEVRRNYSVEVLGMSQPRSHGRPRSLPLLPGSFRGGPAQAKPSCLCLVSSLFSKAAIELSRKSWDEPTMKGGKDFHYHPAAFLSLGPSPRGTGTAFSWQQMFLKLTAPWQQA